MLASVMKCIISAFDALQFLGYILAALINIKVTFILFCFLGKTVEEYRRQLGRFGVSGDLALQQLASLSGQYVLAIKCTTILVARMLFN